MLPDPGRLPLLRVAAIVLAGLLVAACDGAATGAPTDAPAALVAQFQADDRYVPLAEALALTGLDATLAGDGPFTVLAPTRIALRYIGTDFSPVLFADAQRELLARVLRHHVVAGRLGPDDFADGATLTAIDGTALRVRRTGPVVTVNGVTLDVTDATEGTNGVAYPLADVLLDEISTTDRLRLSPSLSTFAAGLGASEVLPQVRALDRLTVLAPLNDAFSGLGAGFDLLRSSGNVDIYRRVLRALVLPGDVDLDTRVGQTVTTLGGDVLAVTRDDATGTLRVDGVRVLVRETTADGRLYLLAEPVLSVISLLDRVRIEPNLSRFLADVNRNPAARAALDDRTTPRTLFVPNDNAYAARYAALNAALAEPAQASLARRVTAVHIVQGRYDRGDLLDGITLPALDGTRIRVSISGEFTTVGDFVLTAAPVRSANGLLYATAFFLLPDVDLLDTILLRGYVGFFRAVRALGLESEYRTQVRTAFILPDDLAPAPVAGPAQALLLRRTATAEFIPDLNPLPYPYAFTALTGDTRTLNRFDCALTPFDVGCSPFGFELVTVDVTPPDEETPVTIEVPSPQVYSGQTTQDRTRAYHVLRSPDFLRDDPPRGTARRGTRR